MLEDVLDSLAKLPALTTYLLLMAFAAVENVFPPVPADVAVALGAFLARRGEVSAPLLGVLCWLANTGSAAGVYFYARSHGRGFFQQGWGSKLMPPEAMAAIERAYQKHGMLGIFLTRFLPGVRAAVTPFAGVAGMPAVRVLVPAAAASAIWYTFLILAGVVLGDNWAAVKTLVNGVTESLGLVGLVFTAAVFVWLWLVRRRARARARRS